MIETLPLSVEINGENFAIRNKCDYRVVLDAISALNDVELSEQEKIQCALYVFYEDAENITDYEIATKEMMRIINNGEEATLEEQQKPKVMDWEHDFKVLVAPMNKVLSCEIRTVEYLHWWTFLAGYMELGECLFSNIVSIRKKKMTGKKLEQWEQEFYRENKKMVDLPQNLTEEEKEWLDSDW
jgi:hypothetical protein